MGQKERVPIEAGFFTIPENRGEAPRLLGSRCRSCDEVFFPRRSICARCYSDQTAETPLRIRIGVRENLGEGPARR